MPLQPNEAFFEQGYQMLRDRAKRMSGQVESDEDTTKLTPDEIDTLWDTRAPGMTLEKEWELHRARQQNGQPTYTPEQIGLMVFPHRERLAKSGGRLEPAEVTPWVNKQEARMTAKRAAMLPPAEGEVY